MRLSVAANYDPQLVPLLQPYPVAEMFGKLPSDLVGGGRATYMGAPLSEKELARYVALLAKHGIGFNYLLNSSCQGNREWERPWQRRLMRFLERLGAMGVRWLTVSTPLLLELVKARFPEFRVKVGVYAQVDTPRRARFWEDLGADAITLESFSINRDFARLGAIRGAVQCDLQLIVNHHCLPNCPMQPYHQNAFAHASDGSGRLLVDYCFFQCTRRRLADPAEFIKAQWIRPEDLPHYEALGYHTFKILERNCPSGELLRRVAAYSRRSYEGNLAEILLPYGFRSGPGDTAASAKARATGAAKVPTFWWVLRHFLRPRLLNPLRIGRLYRMARHQGLLFPTARQPIVIDARAIPPDFLSGFTEDCSQRDCAECGHCGPIARRAVCVDPEFRRQAQDQLQEFADSVRGGRLWGLYPRQVGSEMMDDPGLPPDTHAKALAGLARLTAVSGLAAALWRPIARLAYEMPGRRLRLLDVATGGGDIPLRLWRRARRAGVSLEITGVDISPTALEMATKRAAAAGAPVAFERIDARKELPNGFDIVTCSLFLHHHENHEAIALLVRMGRAAGQLLVVSDLARSRINTALVGLAARVVSRSRVVQVDAGRSARAAFTPEEARGLARAAGLQGAAVTRHWPCTFLLSWRRPEGATP